MAVDFNEQSYWHSRFSSETSFEWLMSSGQFMALIEPHISHLSSSKPPARILNLGSGTSDLQNHFLSRGFTNVVNVDYEPLAAQRGKELERGEFGLVRLDYFVADATKTEIPGGSYDLVVDKGTLDAVACGGDGPVVDAARSVRAALKKGGIWICLSFSAERFAVIEDRIGFDVEVIAQVPRPKADKNEPDMYYWCYLLRPY